MVEIKRDRYLQQLIESRQNGLVKVVTGIRRCGKSYLLAICWNHSFIQEGYCCQRAHHAAQKRRWDTHYWAVRFSPQRG